LRQAHALQQCAAPQAKIAIHDGGIIDQEVSVAPGRAIVVHQDYRLLDQPLG
jgi:hypothetical protein